MTTERFRFNGEAKTVLLTAIMLAEEYVATQER